MYLQFLEVLKLADLGSYIMASVLFDFVFSIYLSLCLRIMVFFSLFKNQKQDIHERLPLLEVTFS